MTTTSKPLNLAALRTVGNAMLVVLLVLSCVALIKAKEASSTTEKTRSTLYHRCVDLKTGGDAANDFRVAEVQAFRAFASDPTVSEDRRAPYLDLAQLAQRAVDAYKPADCSLYK